MPSLRHILLLEAAAVTLSTAAGSAAATRTTAAGAAAPETWCGEFDYPLFATKAPLNITITGATANVSTVWDKKAHGCSHCCAEVEDGLKVTRSSTHITFLGTATAADYYTFVAVLNAAGDEMVGNITTGGRVYGNFSARQHGCPAGIVRCTPSKPPPSPPSPTPGPPRPPTPPGPPPPPPGPHAPVPVWPLPLKLNCTKALLDATPTTLLSNSATIKLTGAGAASPVAVQAAARYQLLLRAAGGAAGAVKEVTVEVEGSSETLGQTTNYSYSLQYEPSTAATSAGAASVAVSALTPFGVGYAMETLLQLATPKAQASCDGGFSVFDAPGYDHRGLLLDTGRRFYPLELLESTIDAMGANNCRHRPPEVSLNF